MYFPYLRGRQYELIAVRELVDQELINEKIVPIIEPIKPTSTLRKTIKAFIEKDKDIAIIHNPQVGNYEEEFKNLQDEEYKNELGELLNNKNVINAHILNKRSTSQIQKLISNGAQKDELLLVHNEAEFIGLYQENFRTPPKYNLVPYDINFRRKVKSNRILFADRFPKQPRNVDYLQEDDRFFSEDHLYYLEEKFKGFSDYSIVGSEFSESGFAPMAVAIHIVYFDADETLKVRHFVSDSNEDITDPAGKFYEALTKLISWSKTQSLNTDAIKEFQKHYDNETYPGLGYVKKLCLKHHIELMNQYLSSRGTNQ